MRRWLPRLGALALVVAGGELSFSLIDSDPQLLEWALTATVVVVLLWLASDVFGVADARWDKPVAPYTRPDAADDSVHHRVVTNHLAAREPSPALAERLLDLARSRDPDLSDPVLRSLVDQPTRRLTPTEIDRILTRIEEPRDHE